eukprot:5260174-Amphidinium_carterae.1
MRGRDDARLTPTEITEYRSTTGCLQWLATSSRIDVAAGCSLLRAGSPEVSHLRGLYEHVHWCQEHPSAGVVFHSLPVQEWLLVGFSDASFSNASGERSQCGMLICLTTQAALTSTTMTLHPLGAHPWNGDHIALDVLLGALCLGDHRSRCNY